jgi:hypothetical protein
VKLFRRSIRDTGEGMCSPLSLSGGSG